MRRARISILFALSLAWLAARADWGGFHYTSFHVEAFVTRDNVWEVTERIAVHFNEPRHGIYRYIPKQYTINHNVEDGLAEFHYFSEVDVTGVLGADYSTEDSDADNEVIRLGDADKYVEGPAQYEIRYRYTYRDDRRDDHDYIFHTVLGYGFNEDIQNFSFKVEFEKELPADIADILEVHSGELGSKGNTIEGLSVDCDTHVISGSADHIPPHNAVTLYARLPQGYYENPLTVSVVPHILWWIFAIVSIIAIIVALASVKRYTAVKVIEFYPPEGISSAEVGVITDNSVDNVDVASLIIWLAGNGNIEIEDTTGRGKSIILHKKKDLPKNAPAYQQKMMKSLFGKEIQVDLKDTPILSSVASSLRDHFSGKRALTHCNPRLALYLALWVTGTGVLGTDTLDSLVSFDQWCLAVCFWTIPFVVGFVLSLFLRQKHLFAKRWKRTLGLVARIVWMLCSILVFIELQPYDAPTPSLGVAMLFLAGFTLCELAGRFITDTEYRAQMAGRLLGFREFIQTAEKPRLEALQEADPDYFYKVLPYAMVFGLAGKWAKRFSGIKLSAPDWYRSGQELSENFTPLLVTTAICSAASSGIQIASPSSSGGYSGRGGGGYSGGGGGGGGGGSW